MPRAYELIGVFLKVDEVKTINNVESFENKIVENAESNVDLIRRNGFNATLPYTSSGVRLGQAGDNIFGGANYYSTQLGEGQTQWRNSRVYFAEKGLRIDETEQFIHYKQIDYIDYSEKSDRKGLFAFKRNGVTFIMKNGEQIIMRVKLKDLNAIKYCIEEDMQNIKENEPIKHVNNDDILIKYFDMFEQGLITRDEFFLKKEEMQSDDKDDGSVPESEPLKTLYCGNCGSLIEECSKFCTNCGKKLI